MCCGAQTTDSLDAGDGGCSHLGTVLCPNQRAINGWNFPLIVKIVSDVQKIEDLGSLDSAG